MFITGFSCLCDSTSTSQSYVRIQDTKITTLQGGYMDDLYITENRNDTYHTSIWDKDTILHAAFEGNVTAGNVDALLRTTDSIILKRRKKDTQKWVSLFRQPILKESDFSFLTVDWFCKNNTEYEYAVVPCKNGTEMEYSVGSIKSNFKGLVMSDAKTSYQTIYDISIDNRDKNIPMASTVTTLNSKYPYIIVNGTSNYDTVKITFGLLDYDYDKDEVNLYDNWEYHNAFLNFLAVKSPKIIKNEDGRIWMGYITNPPNETAGDHPYYTKFSFDFTEIGDTESTEDLYKNGLIDIDDWMVVN